MTNESQRVKFLDVGHGDCSVIYLKDNKSERENVIIIDIADSDRLLEELEKNSIKVIDLIVISHSDADHCRGVNNFLEKYLAEGIVKKVCFVLDRRLPTKTMRLFLKKFLEISHKRNVILSDGKNDTSIHKRELIKTGESKLFLVYPNVAEATEAYLGNETNNASIVCLLENDACNVLFPGDLEKKGWSKLLERIPDLSCEVLKMPHHGAFYDEGNGMGSKGILEVLSPDIAIVSSGRHQDYGHPEKETIRLLNERKTQIYCTEFTSLCHCDMNEFKRKCYGDIEIVVVGTTFAVRTETENLLQLDHSVCNR